VYDKTLYKQRNRIERCFSRLKNFRRFRYPLRQKQSLFPSVVALACSTILLLSIVDTA